MVFQTERDIARKKIEETKSAIAEASGDKGANSVITAASNARLKALEEEIKQILLTSTGKDAQITPANKKRIEEIYATMEDIKTANTGKIQDPGMLTRFYRGTRDQLKESTRPISVARNVALAGGLMVGLHLLTMLTCVALPWSLGAVAGGAILYGIFKLTSFLCRKAYEAYNDSPGSRMDAAAVRAGLVGGGMSPAGSTPGNPQIVIHNQSGKSSQKEAPSEQNKFSL